MQRVIRILPYQTVDVVSERKHVYLFVESRCCEFFWRTVLPIEESKGQDFLRVLITLATSLTFPNPAPFEYLQYSPLVGL